MAQRAGHSVRAEMHDRPTAEASVTPNCVKNEPDVPGMKATGMNTAMKTSVHEMTATDTSLMASRVASRGPHTAPEGVSIVFWALVSPSGDEGGAPLSSFAMTASTTTMASSTTVPMASTKANSVRMFREKPASDTMANVPNNDTMIESEGMTVALKLCKKK